MKRIVLLLAMLSMSVFLVAPAALAQGPQGQVERGPDHANSICSFSGLNDDPEEGGQVQSYGQGVRLGFSDPTDKTNIERPGVLCNAHLFPYPEGFGEETP
jgi:hypothetical protein